MKTYNCIANYKLSEIGRKKSLLLGGSGEEIQEISLELLPEEVVFFTEINPNGKIKINLIPRMHDMQTQVSPQW